MPTAPADPTGQDTAPVAEHAGPGSADDGTGTRPPRLVSDTARYTVANAVTAVLAAAYASLVAALDPDGLRSLRFVVLVYFGAWSVYSLLYAGLTWAVLHRADGVELTRWLTEDRRGRRRRQRAEWFAGSGGPYGAVSFCAAAIGAVAAATVLPQLRGDPLVIVSAVLVVISSWLLILVVYTVHYARENTHHGGLEFRGADDGPPRPADYLYLAVQVGTAYNGADVVVTSRAMRRTVTGHAVVAFVYNTVLIALLVSLLVTVTT